MKRTLAAAVLAGLGGLTAAAQTAPEILERLKALEEKVQALESEVRALKSRVEPPTAITVSTEPQPRSAEPLPSPSGREGVGALPYYGSATASTKIFNPDMAAIGTFRGAAGSAGPRGTPALEMPEAEVALQAIVDPYARADFFLSFGESGVELEEGFLTFSALPGGFQFKAGKMRAAFGKVNTFHSHALPWVDRPLVTQNLLAGEEGINDAGLSLSRSIPMPGQIFLEATGQLYRGDSGDLFRSQRRSNVGAVGRLRGYRDLSESTNLDLGFSYARGHSALGLAEARAVAARPSLSGITRLYGVDATLRWKPLRRAIYRSFLARSELVWGQAELGGATARPLGYYVSGEYQLARRWHFGGRFDRSERLDLMPLRDTAGSILLTFRPSEFSQIRGQLRRARYGERFTANEFLFQFQFSIGAHGAHPF